MKHFRSEREMGAGDFRPWAVEMITLPAAFLNSNRHRRGVTLVDVLVSIVVVVLLFGAVLPAAVRSPIEMRNRISCAKNLARIAETLSDYAKSNRGAFPRGRYDTESGKCTTYTGVDLKDKKFFGDDSPEPNDVTAAFFVLLRVQALPYETFVCPSTDTESWDYGGNGKSALDHGNFPDGGHLSYSFQNCYPTKKVAEAGFRWDSQIKAEFIVVADKNYGDPAILKLTPASAVKDLQQHGNTNNHNRDGQNVLFGDGHVDFRTTPFCGIEQDNIYTYGRRADNKESMGIIGPPAHPADTVLLPADGRPGGQ